MTPCMVLVFASLGGCSIFKEQELSARANVSQCSKFTSPDKKAWCQGRCDLVKDTEYKGMCERFQLRKNR